MRFLTLYTTADSNSGAPGPDGMAAMRAFMETSIKSGVLIATGGVMPSAANGMRMNLANGSFDVQPPSASKPRQSGGWAILEVTSPEHLQQVTRQFLEVAGDGVVEVMEITQMPMR